MNPLPFLAVLHLVIVLLWGYLELLRVLIGGRWRPATVAALMASSLTVFFVLAVLLHVTPDAFACSDQAEVLIEAVGANDEFDFINCTLYWHR